MTTSTAFGAWLAIAVAVFGGAEVGAATPSARFNELAERHLDGIARSLHGFAMLSKENRIWLEQTRRDPAPYLAFIRGKYAPDAVASLASDRRAADVFIVAAIVLSEIDSPAAADILEPWWVNLNDAVLSARDPTNAEMLARMRYEVLGALRSHPRDAVVLCILDQIEWMDRGTRVASLRYLWRSSQGNTGVIRRLSELYDTPASPLYGDRDLLKAISSITGDPRPAAEWVVSSEAERQVVFRLLVDLGITLVDIGVAQ